MTRTDTPLVDFDHHSEDHAARQSELYDSMRASRGLVWSEAHGGFWIATRYDDVVRIAKDDEAFSQDHDVEHARLGAGGVTLPPGPGQNLPIESDPPVTSELRRILMPWYTPAAAERERAGVRRLAGEAIDRVIRSGRIDFVADLGAPVPVQFVLHLMGAPIDDWVVYAQVARDRALHPAGEPGHEIVVSQMNDIMARLSTVIDERRAHPGDDMVSTLLRAEVLGEQLDDVTIQGILAALAFGGFDTATATFSRAMAWLGEHPEERLRLIEEPIRIVEAIEEFLRAFSPNPGIIRTAKHDVEIDGHTLRAGERVLVLWAAANTDPEVFTCPHDMQLDRPANRHVAFGAGIHKCLGQHHGRMELRVLLETVLTRIPEYEIDWDSARRHTDIGTINGFIELPATFRAGDTTTAAPDSHGVRTARSTPEDIRRGPWDTSTATPTSGRPTRRGTT